MSISVFAYNPITLASGDKAPHYSGNLMAGSTGYSHNISVDGGYKSMSIGMASTSSSISDWMSNGLGRHIETVNEHGIVIWEGLVNEVGVEIGGVSLTVGPLIDMANRVYVTYTGTSWTALGVTIGGGQKTTDAANNTDSQAIYGIYEDYISGGTGSQADMNALRDVNLGDRAQPFIAQASISAEGGSIPSIMLSCIGYSAIFDKFRYSSSAITESNASDKVMDVINADPSTRFSTSTTFIAANTLQVSDKEEDQPTANTVIKSVVILGDVNDKRYTFGVYNDREIHYAPVGETAYYVYNVPGNPDGIRRIFGGSTVEPWNIVPGKWLVMTGMSTANSPISNIAELRANPYAMYIEEATYTAPHGLSLTSGPTGTFAQKLARMGLKLQ